MLDAKGHETVVLVGIHAFLHLNESFGVDYGVVTSVECTSFFFRALYGVYYLQIIVDFE